MTTSVRATPKTAPATSLTAGELAAARGPVVAASSTIPTPTNAPASAEENRNFGTFLAATAFVRARSACSATASAMGMGMGCSFRCPGHTPAGPVEQNATRGL